MEIKKFSATFMKVVDKEAGYIEIPFDVEKEFGAKRVKVKAMLCGIEYRGSIVRMGTECHILGIPKEIRVKMGKTFGDVIDVELEVDTEERKIELTDEFKDKLMGNKEAYDFFNSLSFSNQKKYALWIESAKKEETRIKRIDEAVGLLANKKIR